MRSLLILLFLSFSFATLTQVDEPFNRPTKNIDPNIRIKHGSQRVIGSGTQIAPPDMFPFMAILHTEGDIHPQCSGTIIDGHHILTSATCLKYWKESQIVVRVGTNRYDSGGTNYTVAKFIRHPEFDIPVNSKLNDIAIIRINGSIAFGPHVKAGKFFGNFLPGNFPPCIPVNINHTTPPIVFPNISHPGIIAGWGNWVELQYIQLPIVTYAECLRELKALAHLKYNVFAPNQLCTYKNGGQSGSCTDDRGGPLMLDGYQIGIISWGGACNDRLPNVYTNLICYRKWFGDNIDQE